MYKKDSKRSIAYDFIYIISFIAVLNVLRFIKDDYMTFSSIALQAISIVAIYFILKIVIDKFLPK